MRTVKLGQVVITPGAQEALMEAMVEPIILLRRHQCCDWGDLCEEDIQANDEAYNTDLRLLSSYNVPGAKIWIITEWDRSSTTVLLPDEY